MTGPRNASLDGAGFRFYSWVDGDTGEETRVLSVTSIAKLNGENYNLVNWQLANLADAALGTMKRTIVGPRGGVKQVRAVAEFPSEFARRYDATQGKQVEIDRLRKWLRDEADHPRNIAAARGTIVHEAIEKNIAYERIERPYVEAAFSRLSQKDRRRVGDEVEDEDVSFVRNAIRQYWDMRANVPFVILAREKQVWNLTAGYAGSPDTLLWFLPEGYDVASIPKGGTVTMADIERVGGFLAVGDWKTSADVHTDHVIQVMAYGAAEFVGANGLRDERLSAILHATTQGVLVHIRPDGWGVDFFDFSEPILRAFLGRVAAARFIAMNPKPQPLFTRSITGKAPEETDV